MSYWAPKLSAPVGCDSVPPLKELPSPNASRPSDHCSMTTADTVFAQPDRLRDYEENTRTVFWALLVAILIHLIVAFLLAAFSGFFSPSLPAPEKPVELTFMDLSPASAWKNSAFIEPDESKKAPEPKDKTFESNANSIGASELAAAGEMPLPSQTGKDQPFMDLETQQHALDLKGAQAQ